MNLSNTTFYILSAVTCYEFYGWSFANGQITYNRRIEYTEYNGLFDFRYPMDTVATFTCSEGYELVGSSTRTCNPSGDWSSSTPRCREKGDHKYQNSFMWIVIKIDRQFLIVMHTYASFSQIDKIGNNGNIGIRGFTTWKKFSGKM